MISAYLKLSVLALTAALLALTLRKNAPDTSLLLTLAACVAAGGMILSWIEPILDLFLTLGNRAGLDEKLTAPLLKASGIGFLTQFASSVCADAGQTALSKLVELGGTVLCLCISLPLLDAVLSLIEKLL